MNYAGIGSRGTPNKILIKMSEEARKLQAEGYILFSGGASGADSAFHYGSKGYARIFLPSAKFNGWRADGEEFIDCTKLSNWKKAKEIAREFHPNWFALSPFAKNLMGRNSYQILGPSLDEPVDFVLCWTPDGSIGKNTSRDTGGTGQALRIAYDFGIPITNFGR